MSKLIQLEALRLCAVMMATLPSDNPDYKGIDAFKNHSDSDKIVECAPSNLQFANWLNAIKRVPTVDEAFTKLTEIFKGNGWIVYEPTDKVLVPNKYEGWIVDQLIKVDGELVTQIYQKPLDLENNKVMAWTDYMKFSDEYVTKTYITDIVKYQDGTWNGLDSESYWWDRIGVLPPCREMTVGGFELFHISERITNDIVAWYARCEVSGDVYQFQNRDSLTREQIQEILNKAKG